MHAVDHGEVVSQVGDEAGHVGKLLQSGEGRAAFEVNEHERHDIWRMREREARHDRAQKLALA